MRHSFVYTLYYLIDIIMQTLSVKFYTMYEAVTIKTEMLQMLLTRLVSDRIGISWTQMYSQHI